LATTATGANDPPCRFFATLALGHCATPPARVRLLVLLEGGPQQRPWAAMALGLCERGIRARDSAAVPDDATSKALVEAMNGRDAEFAAAAAVGAGLADIDCAEALRALLGNRHDVLAASAVDALWLRRDRAVVPDLRKTLDASLRRPDLLRQVGSALFAL